MSINLYYFYYYWLDELFIIYMWINRVILAIKMVKICHLTHYKISVKFRQKYVTIKTRNFKHLMTRIYSLSIMPMDSPKNSLLFMHHPCHFQSPASKIFIPFPVFTLQNHLDIMNCQLKSAIICHHFVCFWLVGCTY